MKLIDILQKYNDSAVDKLAADKVDEPVNLRLPRSIIVQEIHAALSSLSYVATALAPSRPPTYAFIKSLLDIPNHLHIVEGFQEKVLSTTKEMTQRSQSGKGLSAGKNYQLYINGNYSGTSHALRSHGRNKRSSFNSRCNRMKNIPVLFSRS